MTNFTHVFFYYLTKLQAQWQWRSFRSLYFRHFECHGSTCAGYLDRQAYRKKNWWEQMKGFKMSFINLTHDMNCVKNVCIGSYSGLHFFCIFPHLAWIRRDSPHLFVFSPKVGKCRKNADQNNSEYRHFLRTDVRKSLLKKLVKASQKKVRNLFTFPFHIKWIFSSWWKTS